MSEDKPIKLFTAAKELNIGTGTIVDFLATKGYKVQKHPTALLDGDMYNALLKEFAVDKIIKEEAKQINIGKIRKDEPAQFPEKPVEHRRSRDFENEEILIKGIGSHYNTPPSVEKPKPVEPPKPVEAPKPEKAEDTGAALPGVKVVGKIDLNNLNAKPAQPEPPAAPKEEVAKPAAPQPPVAEPVKETPKEILEPTPAPAPAPKAEEVKKEVAPVVEPVAETPASEP